VLRLVYIGQLELTPQEAYYWNFARHLDLGISDHPPDGRWLIAGGPRLGRQLNAGAAAAVIARWSRAASRAALARDLADAPRQPASGLAGGHPAFFFGVGVVMTPDAPLTAAWAAALYFLHARCWPNGARVDRRRRGHRHRHAVQVHDGPAAARCAGLRAGGCSRAAHAALTMALGRRAGRLARVLSVVVWNMQHDWASFTFQGRAGWRRSPGPSGCTCSCSSVRDGHALGHRRLRARARAQAIAGRPLLFAAVFTLVPLVPLAVTSLWTETKFHWTGPIWLAALPLIAAALVLPPADASTRRFDGWLAQDLAGHAVRLWSFYALVLFYYPCTAWRHPRPPPLHRHRLARPARAGAADPGRGRARDRQPSGHRRLDRNNMASEMAYYDPSGDGSRETAAATSWSTTTR
jgi:dolichol-phosphate mannosyltransferase